MSEFSVVTVTYHTGQALQDCIDSLLSQKMVAEILVIDNGNPASAQDWLDGQARREPRIRILRQPQNLGFAAGCNLGATKARSDILAFVNPDLRVEPDSFARLGTLLDTHPEIWLAGARLLDPDGHEQQGGRREFLTPWRAIVELLRLDRLMPNHPHFRRFNLLDEPAPAGMVEVPVISGAFMAIGRERYLSLGGMDERMFLHLEDVDLCLRIHKQGGRVGYCGQVPVYHRQGSSDVARSFVEWHKTRSSQLYFAKHFSDTYPRWSLRLLNIMLYARFLIQCLRWLPADAAWAFDRLVARRR